MLRSKADDSISTAVQEAAVCVLSPLKLLKETGSIFQLLMFFSVFRVLIFILIF